MKPLEDNYSTGEFLLKITHMLFKMRSKLFIGKINKPHDIHSLPTANLIMKDGTLEHRNICIVSDIEEHSTSTVYAFQQVVI